MIVDGCVTQIEDNGFYLQDPIGDGNLNTSDGIFVFTLDPPGPNINVGSDLSVEGTVFEFFPGGSSSGNLPVTEIIIPTITINPSTCLPSPTVLGTGGRVLPDINIDDDELLIYDPTMDGIDLFESIEGMLVQINDAQVVGPTDRFNQINVVGDNGANAGSFTLNGGLIINEVDFNPERLQIADNGSIPGLDVGTKILNPLVGVVDYRFGNYFVSVNDPTFSVDISEAAVPEVSLIQGDDDRLTIGNLNLRNLGGDDDQDRFDSITNLIITNMNAPDIVGLQEVQDNNGSTDAGTIDASLTLNRLTTTITGASGPTYNAIQIDPLDGQNGGQPGGNIRNAFLYNPDRVQFVPIAGGDATTATNVTCDTGVAALDRNPGLIDPTNPAFDNSRKPLVGEFQVGDAQLFVIDVHLISKRSDTPLFGSAQPPLSLSENQRLAQAGIVNDFVDDIIGCDPGANILVMGDVNDFTFSPVLATLEGGVLTNLTQTLDQNDQYTFNFEGNSQALSHMLVNDSLFDRFREYDIVHANADFADATRSGDRDPILASFEFFPIIIPTIPEADLLSVTKTHSSDPVEAGDTLIYTITVENAGPDDAINVQAFDTLPPGVTFVQTSGCINDPVGVGACALGDIAAHGSTAYTIEVTVDTSTTGTLSNTVSAISDTEDPNPSNNSFTLDTQIDDGQMVSQDNEGNILVIGTSEDDVISFSRGPNDTVRAVVNGERLGPFVVPDDGVLSAKGGSGDDRIQVLGTLEQPVHFDGGDDNDTLAGGRGNDILIGGPGDDRLFGRSGDDIILGNADRDLLVGATGRDLLIGGQAPDTLRGGRDDDILIGGTVLPAADDTLNKILFEWTSSRSYTDRVSNIRGGTGPALGGTGASLSAGTTVLDDALTDVLFGNWERDWFFVDLDSNGGSDVVRNRRPDEFIDDLP